MNELKDPIAELEEWLAEARAFLAQHATPVSGRVESRLAALTLDAWGLVWYVSVVHPHPSVWEAERELARLLEAASAALAGRPPTARDIAVTPTFDPARPAPSAGERLFNGGTDDGGAFAKIADEILGIEGRGRSGAAYAVVRPGGAVTSLSLAYEDDPALVMDAFAEALVAATDDAAEQIADLVKSGALNPDWAITKMMLSNPYKEYADA